MAAVAAVAMGVSGYHSPAGVRDAPGGPKKWNARSGGIRALRAPLRAAEGRQGTLSFRIGRGPLRPRPMD